MTQAREHEWLVDEQESSDGAGADRIDEKDQGPDSSSNNPHGDTASTPHPGASLLNRKRRRSTFEPDTNTTDVPTLQVEVSPRKRRAVELRPAVPRRSKRLSDRGNV